MAGKRLQPVYGGQVYPSIRALAAELKVDHKTLKRRIDAGEPEESWGRQQAPLPSFTPEQLQALLNERLSYPEIAQRLGTTDSAIEHKVARWGLQRPLAHYQQVSKDVLLEAMEQGLSKTQLAEKLGFKSYSPISDACRHYGLKWEPKKVPRTRQSGSNLTPITYQGKDFPSVQSLSREIGIPYNTLLARIKKGWSETDWTRPLKAHDTDMTGMKFGRLTAIRLTKRGSLAGNQKPVWLFQCDCGKPFEANKGSVVGGKTRSCGCLRAEGNAERFGREQKAGDVFGELTVIGPAGRGGDHGNRLLWKCRCSCGRTTVVPGKNLRNGNTRSCGHLAGVRDDLTGQTFGRLTVIDLVLANPGAGKQRIWLCQCRCGNPVEVPTSLLVNGNTKSCGCLKSDTAVLNFKNEGVEAYRLDPEYALRESYVYLVEVAGVVDKIGIAFDMDARSRSGNYTDVWWVRQLTRAQCWAVEQVALSLTVSWAPESPYYDERGHSGPSEQRSGWYLDEIIPMMEDLCDEAVNLGWYGLLEKYQLAGG